MASCVRSVPMALWPRVDLSVVKYCPLNREEQRGNTRSKKLLGKRGVATRSVQPLLVVSRVRPGSSNRSDWRFAFPIFKPPI